jgi:hypothetical protein
MKAQAPVVVTLKRQMIANLSTAGDTLRDIFAQSANKK